jgi:ribonucleoside-diphosphate reductase alpha chain
VADYINSNIKEPYVLEQMQKILKESGVQDETATMAKVELVQQEIPKKMAQMSAMQMLDSNEEVCPSCKAKLIITEGCNICIECGFSSCASG